MDTGSFVNLHQGGLTIPQWAVLADHKKDAKERIVSSPLPSNSLGEPPLLIPCLIEAMTGGRVMCGTPSFLGFVSVS
jgi:hypothetical protein